MGGNPKPPAPVGTVLPFLVTSGEQFIEMNTSSYQHSNKKSLDLEKISPPVFWSSHSPLHLLHLARRLGEVCVLVALASEFPISLEWYFCWPVGELSCISQTLGKEKQTSNFRQLITLTLRTNPLTNGVLPQWFVVWVEKPKLGKVSTRNSPDSTFVYMIHPRGPEDCFRLWLLLVEKKATSQFQGKRYFFKE